MPVVHFKIFHLEMIIYLCQNVMQSEKTSQNSLAFYNEDKVIITDCNEKFSSTRQYFWSHSSIFAFWSGKDVDSQRNSCPWLAQAVLLIF